MLEAERAARGVQLDKLTAADCVPDGLTGNLEGKVAVLKPEKLAPEFRSIDYQLVLVTGGFGASPPARGRTVFCTELFSGKKESFSRDAISRGVPARTPAGLGVGKARRPAKNRRAGVCSG